jgi:hypothetical protein
VAWGWSCCDARRGSLGFGPLRSETTRNEPLPERMDADGRARCARSAAWRGSGGREVLSGVALSPRRILFLRSGSSLRQVSKPCLEAKDSALEPEGLVVPQGRPVRDSAPLLEDFVLPVASRARVGARVRNFESAGCDRPGTAVEASPRKPRGPAFAEPRHPQSSGVLPRNVIHAIEMELCDPLSNGAEMRIAQAWPAHAGLKSAVADRRDRRRDPRERRCPPQGHVRASTQSASTSILFT